MRRIPHPYTTANKTEFFFNYTFQAFSSVIQLKKKNQVNQYLYCNVIIDSLW